MPRVNSSSYEESIPEVREKFLERYEQNKDEYDDIDIDRLRQKDWSVKRFILYNKGDIDAALEQLDQSMKWRKSYGINHFQASDLPKEFIESGGLFQYEPDVNGRIMVYLRCKVHKNIPELAPHFRKFIIGIINDVDLKSGETGFGFTYDVTGVSLKNADINFVQFIISTLRSHFPRGLRIVIVYNLPKILRPLWYIAKAWVGDSLKMIHFVNGDEIKKFIPSKNLPKYLGGECEKDFTHVPEGCKSVIDLADDYGFTTEEVKGYLKAYEPHIKEAYQMIHS